jgi:hypothetical protein
MPGEFVRATTNQVGRRAPRIAVQFGVERTDSSLFVGFSRLFDRFSGMLMGGKQFWHGACFINSLGMTAPR